MHIVHNAVRNLFYREVNEPMAVWLGFFFAFSFSIFQSLQFSDAIVMRNQKKQKQKKSIIRKTIEMVIIKILLHVCECLRRETMNASIRIEI